MHFSHSLFTTLLYSLSLTHLAIGSPIADPNPSTDSFTKRALGLGAPCNEAPHSCSTGLSCLGLDNHLKCVCNKPRCYSYNVNHLSGLPGCREDSNPGGLGYTRVTKCGCGDALVRDACGNGKASIVWVTSQEADVYCGHPC